MANENTFTDFLRRIRAGDEQAAAELVRQYEPLIRREVRLHMEDRRLSRLFDSTDVCQSVLASFFVRATAGQYNLERPEQVLKLLVQMARNKLVSHARRESRQRRDHRRAASDPQELERLADNTPTPSQLVAGRELLDQFRQRLSDQERQLADLRGQGVPWADVAAQLGGTPRARRMQLARAVDRVARQLGLDEERYE